eukprot:1161229-Pelagomonas_calceolata.AAC.7
MIKAKDALWQHPSQSCICKKAKGKNSLVVRDRKSLIKCKKHTSAGRHGAGQHAKHETNAQL